ncbi:IS3 family transposase [Streptomyces lavendulocolor]|uniref:IS3 family transposase n=1 Tax=Streptomyces lavendulocolor TaxID=67316 RepID=UPI0033BFCCD5
MPGLQPGYGPCTASRTAPTGPRITAELRDDGDPVNHKRIARSMNLQGLGPRRRHRTTVPDQAADQAADLVGRDFTAAEVNTKYVGEITYPSTRA